jgi:hypothetical protein
MMMLLGVSLLSGCATNNPVAMREPGEAPQPIVREAAPTRVLETRYEVRGYQEADDPSIRHEAHAVYRRTRVPVHVESLEIEPRQGFPRASYAPLPPSEELAAELAAQKQITAQLDAISAGMAAMESKAQGQFTTLVSQTAETLRLRRELEEARSPATPADISDSQAQAGPGGLIGPESKW